MGYYSWEPLGYKSYEFMGKFYGGGHTIWIRMRNADNNFVGFFRSISSIGEVHDLHIDGWINIGDYRLVGGIAGGNHGLITNCWVSADIITTHYEIDQDADLGGIVGFNWNRESSKIEYCCMTGNVNIQYPYGVNVRNVGSGTVEASVERTRPGKTVTLTVTSGNLASIVVKDADGNTINLSGNRTDGYTFTMPRRNVNVTTSFPLDDDTIPFTNTTTTLEDGKTYIVNEDVGLSSRITVNGTVNLILGEGKTLEAYKGIELSSENNANLTIEGPGALTIDDCDQSKSGIGATYVGTLTINGGTINANGGLQAAGIGGDKGNFTGGTITINGGVVTARGGVEGCTATATVNGGTHIGGILGHGLDGDIAISGCAYSGTMTGGGTAKGAILGWGNNLGSRNVTNCLYVMPSGQNTTGLDLARQHGGTITVTNSYKTTDTGSYGTQVFATATATANLGDEVEDYGMVKAYTNGILYGGTYYVILAISLADNADNSTVISTNDGYVADVTLTGRTLYKDGAWNTICLPFDVDDFTSTIFADAEVKTLGNSDACNTGFDGTTGTLHLEFLQTDEIEAGQPYIVRWTKPEGYDENPDNFDIVNPTFSAVTVRDEDPTDHALISRDGYVQFIGTFSPTGIYTAAKTNLYLSAANKLHYPEAEGFTVNAHRAYFQLLNGLTAGNPNAGVKAFLLDFGDENSEATGIITTNSTNLTNSDGAWYTLDGRRLSGKPAQKGIYLHNSNKIVIK